ncbi:MAG: M48 family metallopeptidase, partial [Acidobacteria bacterium]|nr:M48 family metallopeptidase [Acidobacteriota bacterium]
RFTKLMDRFMPNWRSLRDQLNSAPLADENWKLREG